MLKDGQTLFFSALRNEEHRRRQQAAAVFAVLWVVSILFTISTSFLLISVQALVLLNTAASLIACVVTQALCSRAGTQQNYPFVFGFYRLSTVVRLGGIIFLVFGCLTTIVESLHRGMHMHHSNPYYLLCTGGLQLVFHVVYRREVRMADRVTGHHGMAGAQSEDILHQACVAASNDGRGGAIGGGDFFKTVVEVNASAASPTAALGGSGGGRTVHNKLTTVAVYLLCPATCMAVSIVMMITDSGIFDTAAALLLAGFYGYTGYQEGRTMLDLLMNKCVTDLRRNRSLERCLRNVKMLDGVLQVQSTVWWNMNVSDSMLLVRVRLMSGCDACAVSQAVRRQLVELATHVYVECIPANGTDGSMGDGSLLSWGTTTSGNSHGHSHEHHGHSHEHHGHSHEHHDEHSAGADGEEFGGLPHNSSNRALSGSNNNASLNTLSPASSHGLGAPVSPYVLQSYTADGLRGRATAMSFPAPPASQTVPGPEGIRSGAHSPRSELPDGFRQPPVLHGPSGGSMSTYTNSNHGSSSGSGAFPAALTNQAATASFPQAPYTSPYGVMNRENALVGAAPAALRQFSSHADETRYGQPVLRTAAVAAPTGGNFPPPPSSQRSGDVPPPVFTPFRPAGLEERRNASSTQDYV